MRIGMLLFCATLVAGCARISGAPTLPTAASSSTVAPSQRDSGGSYQLLYSFRGNVDGGNPQAGLVAVDGTLYGTTPSFGSGYGTVFSVSTSGRVKVIHSFHGYPDGAYPEAGLVWYKNALYGTTNGGGKHENGTVFAVTTSGAERVVHSFGNGDDGAQPQAGLVAYQGVLYGTTKNGGTRDKGTVFEVKPSGDEHVMHSFVGAPKDGGHPDAGLVVYKGDLYGVTRAGGQTAGGGAAFKISLFGEIKLLHSFGVNSGDGSNPAAGLVYLKGNFYGTTLRGGDVGAGYGTVFELNPRGVEYVIHSFGARSDGAFPLAGLVVLRGKLYGTTMGGGLSPQGGNRCLSSGAHIDSSEYYKCGTIFVINQFGQEHVLHRFSGDPDGANPEAGLVALDGLLYGTTYWGGIKNDFGTIFSLFP
jgi:uncharacterized repeat protein (TIGR03803 family)